MAKVTIKDNGGNVVAQFDSNSEENVAAQGQAAGVPIPVACGVGACRMCVGKCEKGAEHIDREAHGEVHIGLEDDEVLTCIAGVKSDAPANAEIEIELENL
ncbi:2Fe-2S iron-sulfur cluster binding domain-containing protein [bacterium]|jgi:ferredoxin|nr:2Fe-2S iron-sulfur cluster binding domain-containing protein [bacterium]MBT6831664.1 2Fe-2S iron-sulfur cluster binding domain-containing protein [bacterium]MBT6996310.1 2Fe-2S iron-sulfur cluster binding domain-containing protein [bacterium]MBT7772988.1 2Fe-2S iron-sulfur cluster binding domain-containing protein [bacterium]